MSLNAREQYLNDWMGRQGLAEQMIPVVGRLYRERGIVIMVYGRRLMNSSTIDILKAHRFARQMVGGEIDVAATAQMLDKIAAMDLAPARIDIGKLTTKFQQTAGNTDLQSFLNEELAAINTGKKALLEEPQDVVLYGFGRIGRLLARLLIQRTGAGNKMRLRAIVVRGGREGDLKKRASLLRRDSVHGPFNGSIVVDEEKNAIIANGNYIQVIYANSPDSIDYTRYGINNALIVDNTGIWKDEEGLGLHLKSKGTAKVLLTAPAKGDIKNIVYGVNEALMGDDKILCAASCTTNAISPVLKVLEDEFGINNGHLETIHAYTNDQNLIDNYHKAERRGRSAPLNMVITSTGAAKAVAKALPELAGKLTGNAIRVPTPNVSMALLNLNLGRNTTKEEINGILREASLHSSLREQIGYTESTELVSSDLVGSPQAGVVDAAATIVEDNRVVLYVWYDNEAGYSNQVIRVMQDMSGLKMINIPA